MTVEFCLDGCEIRFEQERVDYNRMRLLWQAATQATTEAFGRDYAAMDKCRADLLQSIYQLGWLRLHEALQRVGPALGEAAAEVSPSRLAGRWLDNYFDWDTCVIEIGQASKAPLPGEGHHSPPAFPSQTCRSVDLLTAEAGQEQFTPAGLAQRVLLYNSRPVRARLEQAFFSNAFSIHLALLDLLKRSGRPDYRAVGVEEVAAAQEMYAFIQAGRVSKYRLAAACCELLTLDPYNRDYYLNYLTRVGDQRNELERMAEFCGVTGFRAEKEALIRQQAMASLNGADKMSLTKELKRLVAACSLFGLNPDNQWVSMLEGKIANLGAKGDERLPLDVVKA